MSSPPELHDVIVVAHNSLFLPGDVVGADTQSGGQQNVPSQTNETTLIQGHASSSRAHHGCHLAHELLHD
jgi:hypothetical protein